MTPQQITRRNTAVRKADEKRAAINFEASKHYKTDENINKRRGIFRDADSNIRPRSRQV